MGDSNVLDISKLKVVELRKELKSRGLSSTGDKAELLSRLQSAISQDDNNDMTLDSDEIDSDVELDDIDDKNQPNIMEEHANEVLNEELALSDNPTALHSQQKAEKPTLTAIENKKKLVHPQDTKETLSKKIVLNRTTPISSHVPKVEPEPETKLEPKTVTAENKLKLAPDSNSKIRLEMRAKRFGLPIKMSEQERKEARRQRFSQSITNNQNTPNKTAVSLSEDIEKLQKRAERFGQSVSKVMTELENKERLEKRKAKFGLVK